MNKYHPDTYNLIHRAEELFKLKEFKKDYYYGLLYPAYMGEEFTESPSAYNRPALAITMKIDFRVKDNLYWFFGCIKSIDDSGVSIFGPEEDYNKAKSRLDKFKYFVEHSKYRCPTKTQLENKCKEIGVYANYW